jgi:hypothetical protein
MVSKFESTLFRSIDFPNMAIASDAMPMHLRRHIGAELTEWIHSIMTIVKREKACPKQ